jgi:hypothetical protein
MFDKIDELKSIYRLLRYLVEHGIGIGVRPHDGPKRGNLEWRRPSRGTLAHIVHHPLYGGAFTYGRERLRGKSRPSRPLTDPAGLQGLASNRDAGLFPATPLHQLGEQRPWNEAEPTGVGFCIAPSRITSTPPDRLLAASGVRDCSPCAALAR